MCDRTRFRCACLRRRLAARAPPTAGLETGHQLAGARRAVVEVARAPQRLAAVGGRGIAPVTHLAGSPLRRLGSAHLDTADQIAVPASELGSRRREDANCRPESKRQEHGCPAIARHQISTNLSRHRTSPSSVPSKISYKANSYQAKSTRERVMEVAAVRPVGPRCGRIVRYCKQGWSTLDRRRFGPLPADVSTRLETCRPFGLRCAGTAAWRVAEMRFPGR